MDKTLFKYIYYSPRTGSVVLKIEKASTIPAGGRIDISELWWDAEVLSMLYPQIANLVDLWSITEVKGFVVSCRLSPVYGFQVWNEKYTAWQFQ